MRTHARLACTALLALLIAAPAAAKERAEIPDAYKWNLADLYPSEAAWEQARAAIAASLPGLTAHRGHLGDSAAALLAALEEGSRLDQDLQRLYTYAVSRSDEDTRASRPRELRQAAEQLVVDLQSATAFVRPELLALDPAKVQGFLAKEPKLAPWRFFLEDLLRARPHTLDAAGEGLLAATGNLTPAAGAAYNILKDADLPYPTVKFSTGEARLDPSTYSLYRASTVRADRELAFKEFFGAIKGFERTFGTTLDAHVKTHLFAAKARRFPDSLSAALFRANIPTNVYTQLVSDVRRSLPTLHRYLKLRQRMLGVDHLRYQDLYAPMVGKVDLTFGPEEARRLTLEAFAPLGPAYVAALKKGYQDRWTDFLPSTGKRAGAYSTSGVYGVHPYQLLNFNGQYDDVSTLAHESGHSMHTWLAINAQPYPTADYPIFVAEVASTLNENLLLHHMLGRAKKGPEGDATRLALLGNYLDNLRTTLFRQASFAEFELEIHRRAERGEPLTGEALTKAYLKLVRDYYGHDAGVCQVDDLIGVEWAYVPHFYYDHYVYQYATSLVASTSIAKAIREEQAAGKGTKVRDAYLAMLAAGGSRYPIDLLKSAGVDMTTSRPFDAAIAEMNGVIDEMEKILARQPKVTR